MLHGIDISHHNIGFAQQKLASDEPKFALIKVSEGKGWRDSVAKIYADICIARNIPMFFYHYCRPDVNERPELEVNNFILAVNEVIGARDIPVGLVIDWEDKSIGHELWLASFVKVLVDNTGCQPLIYCSQSKVAKVGFHLDTDEVGLWVAHWGREEGKPGKVHPWKFWAFHQYGIENGIDANVFNGDEEQLKRYQGYYGKLGNEDDEPECGCHCCCCSEGD